MIRDRATLLLAVPLLAVAGCNGGIPVAKPAATSSSTAVLDSPGREGCKNLAIAVRDGNTIGVNAIHLSAAQAAASANADVATAGRALVNVAIRAAASKGEANDAEIKSELVEAQQAVLKACEAVLGDQPW
ncbi:hypothetical protein [Micromonospora echinaurantiaca]|uniref:hypothetical protein n=1 Tax=Micromonospora echinaurantiaca TaxID=47857 RepID=UPI0037903962